MSGRYRYLFEKWLHQQGASIETLKGANAGWALLSFVQFCEHHDSINPPHPSGRMGKNRAALRQELRAVVGRSSGKVQKEWGMGGLSGTMYEDYAFDVLVDVLCEIDQEWRDRLS